MLLKHPVGTSSGLQITLPDPVLGDSELTNIRTKVRQAMDGTRYSFIRTPATKTLVFTLINLNKDKVQEFIDFLSSTAGEEIELVDYNNDSWQGYITTDPNEFQILGRKDGSCIEIATASFEFKGSKI